MPPEGGNCHDTAPCRRRRGVSCAVAAAVLGALWVGMPGGPALAEARCYPGSPVMILRELMGGVDTEENYLAAVTRYVRERCQPGQILKLVSPGGRGDRTDRLNQTLAMALCEQQTIDREPITMAAEGAVLLHCVIAGDPR